MKLAVFGATGRTGVPLVRKALAGGFEVVAFVRSPDKLKEQQGEHANLRWVQGDIQDASKVEAVTGIDAVLSVLGPTENTPDYRVSKGMDNIIATMKAHKVRRLIQSVGAGVRDPEDEPKLIDKVITRLIKFFSKHVYEDMRRVAEKVRTSDLDWTLVRVPMLTNDLGKGSVRVGMVGKNTGPRLSREDMALFMLEQATDGSYIRKAPMISN